MFSLTAVKWLFNTSSNWNYFIMQVLSYIIKIILLPLGQFRSGSDIWTALLNKSNLLIAIGNATLGWWFHSDYFILMFTVIPALELFCRIYPFLGYQGVRMPVSCYLLQLIFFPREICVCLSPLSLVMESCSKCYPTSVPMTLLFKIPFPSCFEFSDYLYYLLLLS